MAERRGICDERKALGEAVRVLGGFQDTRLWEKRAAPGRGKIRWRRAFLQKDAPWCMRVRIGRWGQECKWENLGEKDRISIVAIVFSLIEIHYFYKKVVRYTVSLFGAI